MSSVEFSAEIRLHPALSSISLLKQFPIDIDTQICLMAELSRQGFIPPLDKLGELCTRTERPWCESSSFCEFVKEAPMPALQVAQNYFDAWNRRDAGVIADIFIGAGLTATRWCLKGSLDRTSPSM